MTQRIELNHGAARCLVLPELGGSLGGWWIAGQAMLRPTDEAAIASGDPTRLSGFPLVPYSNRIGHGRFDWNGTTVELELIFPHEPHALHGTGWRAAWDVESHNARDVTLSHSHKADRHWPWPFEAKQHIHLTEFTLTIEMIAHNLSGQLVPLGFGHHPYFDTDAATLTFGAQRIWQTDIALT